MECNVIGMLNCGPIEVKSSNQDTFLSIKNLDLSRRWFYRAIGEIIPCIAVMHLDHRVSSAEIEYPT